MNFRTSTQSLRSGHCNRSMRGQWDKNGKGQTNFFKITPSQQNRTFPGCMRIRETTRGFDMYLFYPLVYPIPALQPCSYSRYFLFITGEPVREVSSGKSCLYRKKFENGGMDLPTSSSGKLRPNCIDIPFWLFCPDYDRFQ